jgi:hypothetical protein
MTVLGLTRERWIAALVIGLVIGVVISFANLPHPVETPVQVITPVPTPPPVVITEHPTPAPTQAPVQQPVDRCGDTDLGILPVVIIGAGVVGLILMLLVVGGGSGSVGMIQGIVMWLIAAVMLMIAIPILNSVMCAMPVMMP